MWTAVIVTLLVMLAVGLVVDQLFRLRTWLNKPPPEREPPPPDA
ncbi:MAG TPA: hypothetical protein VH496_15025 [Mycobacterium sp.]|jgi:hypothetical protein